jgi:hypothetical protein
MRGMMISTGNSFIALEYRLIQKPAKVMTRQRESQKYQLACRAGQ